MAADSRRSNHVTIRDLERNETLRDWRVVGGDLVPTTSMAAIFEQAFRDALECRFNSMPKVLPRWGNEGIDLDFSDLGEDSNQYDQEQFIEEILDPLKGPLAQYIKSIKTMDFTFPLGSPATNTWTLRLLLVLNDRDATLYDRLYSWDGGTGTVAVS